MFIIFRETFWLFYDNYVENYACERQTVRRYFYVFNWKTERFYMLYLSFFAQKYSDLLLVTYLWHDTQWWIYIDTFQMHPPVGLNAGRACLIGTWLIQSSTLFEVSVKTLPDSYHFISCTFNSNTVNSKVHQFLSKFNCCLIWSTPNSKCYFKFCCISNYLQYFIQSFM